MKLTVKTGQFSGVTVDITDNFTIGRSQEAGLFIPDPQVSRRHTLLTLSGDDVWIEDAGSHNGTFVNDIKVERRRILRNGDMIRIGNSRVEVSGLKHDSARHTIQIEEENTSVTMTVEHSAKDMAPPTVDILATENAIEGFSFPSVNELRNAPDRSLSLVLSNARRFGILFHVARSLQQSTSIQGLLATMMDHVFRVLKADRGDIVLVDPDTEELLPMLSVDRAGNMLDTVRISHTIIQRVINSKMAIISTDAASDPRLAQAESVIMFGMRSIMCVPIISKERAIGIVQVVNESNLAAFTEEDMYLLTVIASLAGVSLDNARLHEEQKTALDELKRANEELVLAQEEVLRQEKLATVGQLASGIAHEIRNTLGPIALVHLLKERHPDDEVLQEYAGLILESHNRILSIISEVRNFTAGRADAGQGQREQHSLRTLLESVLNFLKFDRDVKRASVSLNAVDHIEASINPERIKQVVINLVRNAAQAVPSSGGKIELTLAQEGDEAVIRIADNGGGIPEENLEKVWTPFFTTKSETGMGLGLDICRMIVEQHEGRITCTSTVGEGTTMSVFLNMS